ncbi:TrmH family RNA methyltransferase [Rhodopirellula sallentina]|uniref:tRNA/rRNA methyltransferase (SpoU) n=1 Tax=Rhodopirellula sallentina SM41 TaxID=1263870 RepID=M5UFJ3_9BACT|nr:TrmH family RNA methyltransferase [Rhodopirellula sallentina]EMI56621.1 tRNA/rRNA methyltransferase (SpoU) [Rhodopirellula sallentina SM41]
MEILRSSQNATIRRLAGLRNNRRRRAAGVVLVDGARETLRAIESGMRLLGFYEQVAGETLPIDGGPELQSVRAHAIESGVYRGVTRELFAKVCYGEADDRCLAEFVHPGDSLADLPELRPGLVLVLDRVEKPGNIGAIFRTADGAGVSAVLLSDCPSDRFNANAIRGSLGAVFTVPAASGTASEIAEYLSDHVDEMFAMRVEGSTSLYTVDLSAAGPRGRTAVIMGSEADGLAQRWQEWRSPARRNDQKLSGEKPPMAKIPGIHLPMAGHVDSLNVSVSAALVAYESVRQRCNRCESDVRND